MASYIKTAGHYLHPQTLRFLILCLFIQPACPAMAANPVAQIISIKGAVEVRTAGTGTWAPAAANQTLYAGDSIRTGSNAKTAILLVDETQMQINKNSQLELKEVAPISGWQRIKTAITSGSIYNLFEGEIWLRNKNREVSMEINTTQVSAGIRGTEINLHINPDNSVNISVLEGTIEAWNGLGRLNATAGEEVIALPGAAPRKTILVEPQDAVQWTLTVPRLFGAGDFPLLSSNIEVLNTEYRALTAGTASALTLAEQTRLGKILRDLGRTDEAITIFQRVTASVPEDPDANTGLGWALLDKQQYEQALTAFSSAGTFSVANYAGRIIAYADQNNTTAAGNLLREAKRAFPDAAIPVILEAYLNLLSGNMRLAQSGLQALVDADTTQPIAWNLFSLVSVILGDRDLAAEAIDTAIAQNPAAPTPLLIKSYTQQADFDLEGALVSVKQALVLDHTNIAGLLDLARLQFGSDYLDAASATIADALAIAPGDYEVHLLKGFISLAKRDLPTAASSFAKSLDLDPGAAEPYLGLSLIHMRQGQVMTALEEITKASLLDPQRSIYLSYWAKMLYQIKRFDKALDVLDRAQQLDPRDPTPAFYKAIILRDLNRPGEAIKDLNRAVALNANRGVYRSRFLLDKDLAVKNVDLSLLYSRLGLNTWAQRKAVASVKQDYLNYSGHLFFAGSLLEQGDRDYAFASETLLARLLQPANINTFNTFNDYTSLLEVPGMDTNLGATVGTQQTRNGEVILSGAIPKANLAWQSGVFYESTDGWRGSNFDRLKSFAGIAKWQPTRKDGVMLAASYTDTRQGDEDFPRYEFDTPADPVERINASITRVELGYHHNFSPASDLLLYLAHLDADLYVKDHTTVASPFVVPTSTPINVPFPGFMKDTINDVDFANPYYQAQMQYMYKYRRHQLITGSVQYLGDRRANNRMTTNVLFNNDPVIIPPFLPFMESEQHNLDIRFQSYYLQDIWQLSSSITLEGAVYYDKMDNANAIQGTEWTISGFHPRAGLIYAPTSNDTVRLAAFRYLIPFISSRTDPTEIAGIPIIRNTEEGAVNTEYDIVWEHEWSSGMFALNLFTLDKRFADRVLVNKLPIDRKFKGNMDGIELKLDQLVTNIIGMNISYHHFEIDDEFLPASDRDEDQISVAFRFVKSNGLSGGIQQTYRCLDLKDGRANESIPITDLDLGYEFPGKTGTVHFQIRNIFDQQFNWVTDRFVFQGRVPEREIFGTLTLNF